MNIYGSNVILDIKKEEEVHYICKRHDRKKNNTNQHIYIYIYIPSQNMSVGLKKLDSFSWENQEERK